jgi:hypothetical protein
LVRGFKRRCGRCDRSNGFSRKSIMADVGLSSNFTVGSHRGLFQGSIPILKTIHRQELRNSGELKTSSARIRYICKRIGGS